MKIILFILLLTQSSFLSASETLAAVEKLWPTLTAVEGEWLISTKRSAKGFYPSVKAPFSPVETEFIQEQLSGLGNRILERDKNVLQARAGSVVTPNPTLENLMLKNLTGKDFASVHFNLRSMDILSLAKLCKNQKKASFKNGKPVDYVRYSLYQAALKRLEIQILFSLTNSELTQLENLVKSDRLQEARAILQSKHALIFRQVPDLFLSKNIFSNRIANVIASNLHDQKIRFKERQQSILEARKQSQ